MPTKSVKNGSVREGNSSYSLRESDLFLYTLRLEYPYDYTHLMLRLQLLFYMQFAVFWDVTPCGVVGR